MNLTARLQQFYIGYYGRPADPAGLAYWLGQANGIYLNQDSKLAAAFGSVDQAEFRSLYTQTPTTESFIVRVYQNLFGREPETAGLLYFVGLYRDFTQTQGMSGDLARAVLIARVIDGASGSDRVAMTNKVSLATSFTDEIRSKNVSISDSADQALVRSLFTSSGAGSDAWLTTQRAGLSDLVARVQANDSVKDFMDAIVSADQGVTPNPTASARLSYSSSYLLESDANNGQITGSILIEIAGGSFSGAVGSAKGVVSNVPKGLTAKLVKTSATTLTLTFTGSASSHDFASSIANLSVVLTDLDFVGLQAAKVEGSTKTNLGLGFIDSALNITNGIVRASGALTQGVTIDLENDTLLVGAAAGRPLYGSISQASGADFSGTTGAGKFNVSFTGDANANSYKASGLGDLIRGKGGNDALTGGAGKDTFVFESTASANGVDRLASFSLANDILDFSRYLNVTGTKNVKTQVAGSTQITWANGDVLVWQGSNASTAATVKGLFARTATDSASPFSFAKSDGKAVIITAGLTGDAYIWFIKKEANATATFDATKNVIEESDITLVGVLEGVSNIALVPFGSGNFI